MRLIDADRLMDEQCELCPCARTSANCLVCELNEAVNSAPTVDAVPVVRCKDCVHCVSLDAHSGLSSYYQHCTERHGEEMKNVWHKYKKYYKDYSIVEQDGYCVFGERRQNGET